MKALQSSQTARIRTTAVGIPIVSCFRYLFRNACLLAVFSLYLAGRSYQEIGAQLRLLRSGIVFPFLSSHKKRLRSVDF